MMERLRICCGVLAVVCISLVSAASADDFGAGANQFTIDFVTISGDTNPIHPYNIGVVNNDYRMGVYEITNDQWAKFKASLGVPVTGNPTFAYDEDPYWIGTNVPTNELSWHEAAQFVNWLNTSTGHPEAYKFTGTQGTSSYALDVSNYPDHWEPGPPYNGPNRDRNTDAFYYLPTEAEWVKAAYWNGTDLQTYANASPGDLVAGEPDPTRWNYGPSSSGEPWAVGSGVQELNGTYDMMGNVYEWVETGFLDHHTGPYIERGLHGGSYVHAVAHLSRKMPIPAPSGESKHLGFRVASEVPEPATPPADIKPGSWPNPINPTSKGVLPMAICGSEDFDVADIDPSTILLGGLLSPIRWSYEDVATPYEGEPEGGHDLNGDGIEDLTLKFKTADLAELLDLWSQAGQTIPLTISGNLIEAAGGTAFEAIDWARILTPGDANLDWKVAVGDLGILGANYGGSGKDWFTGDFTGDGEVSVGDLGVLGAWYGTDMTGGAGPVPEPITLSLLAFGGLGLLRRRR